MLENYRVAQSSVLRVKREIYLWLVATPRAFVSRELRDQLRLKSLFLPGIPTKIGVMRQRDWGTGVSIYLTPRFSVPLSGLVDELHPEIKACLAGKESREEYFGRLVSEGWSKERAKEREKKTMALLGSDAQDFFSEANLEQSGELRITDGHHRAGIAFAQGLENYRLVLSVKVHLT